LLLELLELLIPPLELLEPALLELLIPPLELLEPALLELLIPPLELLEPALLELLIPPLELLEPALLELLIPPLELLEDPAPSSPPCFANTGAAIRDETTKAKKNFDLKLEFMMLLNYQ
jgi:hypothetical protein